MLRPLLLPIFALGLALSPTQSAYAKKEPLPETAPSDDQPSWTVQVDPLTAALGFAHLQFEYAFAKHHSIYLGPHLRLYNNLLDDKEEDYLAVGIESAYRYFWQGEAPQGPWVQARLVGSYLSREQESSPGGYVSALAGYTWILDRHWVLALGLGIQYLHMRVEGLGVEGVLPAAHTALGVAF